MTKTQVAICFSLIALVLFDGMGLIIKLLSDRFTAMELTAYRNLFGLIPAGLVLWYSRDWHARGRQLKLRQWRLALLRGGIVVVAQLSFYWALGQLSFATATTITYANALFLVALAVPLLGEKVGWLRWGAVLIGFVGVVMVVGPGRDTFTAAALFPLLAAFCYALVGVTARMMDKDAPTALINIYSSIVAAICAFTLTMTTGGFSQITATIDLAWLAGMGFFGGSAVLFLIAAYRNAEQSDLAPFSYFGIPIAFFLGWLFYGEAPWRELFPGAILIAIGGLIVIWREREQRKRQTSTSSAT